MEQVESTILEVRNRRDLDSLFRDATCSNAHILILGDFPSLRERLRSLCETGKVSSVHAVEPSQELRQFATSIDDVPVFLVADGVEARSVAADLRRSPFTAVEKAINATTVALRFLEGRPT